jgi:hypothetical protein
MNEEQTLNYIYLPNSNSEREILYCFHRAFLLIIQLTNNRTNINYFIVFINIDAFPYTCFGPDFNLYDKSISCYTVLDILQIQMCFYNLLLRQVCSSAH